MSGDFVGLHVEAIGFVQRKADLANAGVVGNGNVRREPRIWVDHFITGIGQDPHADIDDGIGGHHQDLLQIGTKTQGLSDVIANGLPQFWDPSRRHIVCHVRIEGLQITVTRDSGGADGIYTDIGGTGELRISHSIMKGVLSGTAANLAAITSWNDNANLEVKIWNNIFYDFKCRQHGNAVFKQRSEGPSEPGNS